MTIAVIGGGAAGFMAAITAAESFPDSKITIFEKNKTLLNKVRISGGGRCNVTHRPSDLRNFIKNYPRGEKILRQLFPQFHAQSTIDWFESRGVKLKTEMDGRMFPVSDSSHTIIQCLLNAARKNNITILTGVGVKNFRYAAIESNDKSRFTLQLDNSESVGSDKLLIATGGYPKLTGFDWLAEHNLTIVTPNPSLFTFNTPENYLLPLAGVSVQDALIKINKGKHEWRGPLLITHWGFSGPAILKLSAWGARELAENNYHFQCKVNWVPELKEHEISSFLINEKIKSSKQQIMSHSRFGLPARLWKMFCQKAGISEAQKWSEAPNKLLNRMTDILTNSQFEVKGKTTFKEEFVTCGGVSLDEVNPKTLESIKMPGLYFAGEVLDIDGITGGFNFQNAWTTGFVVGKCIGT